MSLANNKVSMREQYGKVLADIGKDNQSIVVIGGDLNKSTFTHIFAARFPDRFFDFGPAEQNMMGVAAGLASSGRIPFVSTFSVFGTCRPFDQIRVSIAQPGLNVKIVCTHAGILTGEDGMSAHGIEDLAIMCSLPGFTVMAPADAIETEMAIRAAVNTPGPFYIRLSRPVTPIVHNSECNLEVGKGETLRDGYDVSIIATGVAIAWALEAANTLSEEGISSRVINIHTLKPTDTGIIVKAAKETGAIVTVEEHYLHGGLGSIVAQCIGENFPIPLEMVGLNRYAESGKPDDLLKKYGLTPDVIRMKVKKAISRKNSLY